MKNPKTSKKTTSTPSLASIAEACATKLVPTAPPDLLDALEDRAMSRLFGLACARVSMFEGDAPLTDADYCNMEGAVKAALPADQRHLFVALMDALVTREMTARTASYHVGVAVGRRIAGGAR